MEKFLTELIERKKLEIAELQKRSDESQDVAEVRSIGETLKSLANEVADAEKQLAELNADAERSDVPADAELRNAQVISSYGAENQEGKTMENMEYRNAFMEYVLRGTPIPAELREDANTLTTDVSAVIPTQIVNRIIAEMGVVGKIFNAVTRTAYKGGVQIPVATLKPVATWVGVSGKLSGEGLGSDKQKLGTTSVSFTYHKLRCEVSISMEVGTMALSAFEDMFVKAVANAMVKAIELAIIDGDGTNQPKGILRETPADGLAVTGAISYAKLVECESLVPEQYEADATWVMTKADFYKFVGLVDSVGQPVARVTYGISGRQDHVLLGRPVLISANAKAGTPFIFNMNDYVLNTIYDMGITKKQDWDTEDLLTKAVMSVDGKVVDKGSLVTFAYTPAV